MVWNYEINETFALKQKKKRHETRENHLLERFYGLDGKKRVVLTQYKFDGDSYSKWHNAYEISGKNLTIAIDVGQIHFDVNLFAFVAH